MFASLNTYFRSHQQTPGCSLKLYTAIHCSSLAAPVQEYQLDWHVTEERSVRENSYRTKHTVVKLASERKINTN
jgi:hypothetical protein